MKFSYPLGATPLDPDEIEGLKPNHINIQSELDEWESNNIIEAEIWAFSKKFKYQHILTVEFAKKIHLKMFDKTWKWAGQFRRTLKNIGVDSSIITIELRKLLDDVIYQIDHHTYSYEEIAYRFHHRLVKIHPFANGNGRHARIMADMLLASFDCPRFSWGKENIKVGPLREKYINALRDADRGDYKLLARFVNS